MISSMYKNTGIGPSIQTAEVDDGAITTAKLDADAVDGTKLADDAVGSEHIEDLDANLVFATGANIKAATTGAGTQIGTTASELIAFHGATAAIQSAHIADASAAGTLADLTAAETKIDLLKDKINSIIGVLEAKGLTSLS